MCRGSHVFGLCLDCDIFYWEFSAGYCRLFIDFIMSINFRSEVVKNVDALLGKVCLVVCLPFLSMLLKLTVT